MASPAASRPLALHTAGATTLPGSSASARMRIVRRPLQSRVGTCSLQSEPRVPTAVSDSRAVSRRPAPCTAGALIMTGNSAMVRLAATATVTYPYKSGCREGNGEGGIRTPDKAFRPYNGLANRRLQPLGHLSNYLPSFSFCRRANRQTARLGTALG